MRSIGVMSRVSRFHEEHGGWYAAGGKDHEEHGIKEEQVGAAPLGA